MTAVPAPEPEPAAPRPLAIGWATVDLDRAERELAARLAPGAAFEPAPPCDHLGARCRVGRAADGVDGVTYLVLLEPSTEGRLAATLARHGEGWCVTWVAGPAATSSDPPSGGRHARWRSGPFGPEQLVPGGPVDGPHHLVVAPATIAP